MQIKAHILECRDRKMGRTWIISSDLSGLPQNSCWARPAVSLPHLLKFKVILVFSFTQLETNQSDPSLSFRDSQSRQEAGGLNILIFTASWDINIHSRGPQTSSISSFWDLVKNAESQAPSQIYLIRICILTRFL